CDRIFPRILGHKFLNFVGRIAHKFERFGVLFACGRIDTANAIAVLRIASQAEPLDGIAARFQRIRSWRENRANKNRSRQPEGPRRTSAVLISHSQSSPVLHLPSREYLLEVYIKMKEPHP